jgi:hypothetical protein
MHAVLTTVGTTAVLWLPMDDLNYRLNFDLDKNFITA